MVRGSSLNRPVSWVLEQLALVPGRGLLEEVRAEALVVLNARGEARVLERVVNVEVGPAQLAARAELVAQADQGVGDRAVVGGDAAIILVDDRQVGAAGRLLGVVARAPVCC